MERWRVEHGELSSRVRIGGRGDLELDCFVPRNDRKMETIQNGGDSLRVIGEG